MTATNETTLEALLRRDRAVVGGALALITVLSWAYVLWLAVDVSTAPTNSMPGMDMPAIGDNGRAMGGMLMSSFMPWSPSDAVFMFAMWAVMMVGMMTPSAAPIILLYGRVGRQAMAHGKPFAATAWFAGGYLIAWIAFAGIATGAQWILERIALLTPMMASASDVFGGAILIAAGLYQWTPLKDVCLSQCQAPLVFIQRHGGFRREPLPALLMGARHGTYCVGCCWALMALLFVGGVMNVLWIAGLAIVIFAEKLIPAGRLVSRLVGIGLGLSGAGLVANAV